MAIGREWGERRSSRLASRRGQRSVFWIASPQAIDGGFEIHPSHGLWQNAIEARSLTLLAVLIVCIPGHGHQQFVLQLLVFPNQ